mmetsp:Transcript_25660/g.39290  ORF Transcript_25660/g.39290 Transcript_25660/m.39290 type:complete len:89 (-) Transcript_25660:2105-2371(-)
MHFRQKEDIVMGDEGDVDSMSLLHPRIQITMEVNGGFLGHISKHHSNDTVDGHVQWSEDGVLQEWEPLIQPGEVKYLIHLLGTKDELH